MSIQPAVQVGALPGTHRVILPFPPSANNYWRHNRGRTHRTHEADAYKKHVGLLCMAFDVRPLDGLLCVSFTFYRPAKRGDLDNMLKVTIDSLIGWAYQDDKQIVELHAKRYEDKGDPRVEIVITETA